MNKHELKVQVLTERIAEIVASYEERIAEFRADATIQLTELSNENSRLSKEVEELRGGAVAVLEKETTTTSNTN